MLFTDNPINSANQDALKREPFVKQLAKAILSWQSSEPLVVGIYGQWGDGKSSVLHLLMERLKGEAILTMFDPWYFNSEEELIRSFFINIFGVISKNLPWHSKWKIRRGAQAFSKMLTSLPISVSYGGIALSMKDFENKGINPIQKAELVASLKEREKNDKRKIVVLIDNIDRLTPEEILLVMKLIRLCGDFDNMIYVLAFDDQYVIDSIDNLLQNNGRGKAGEAYLKKIVQVDTRLPAISEDSIDTLINLTFDELRKEYQFELGDDFSSRFPRFYQEHIRGKIIRNLRDAKKLMNAIAFGIPLVKSEVNYADWIVVEVLRVFCPRSYTVVQENICLLVPDYTSIKFTMSDYEWKDFSKRCEDLTARLPDRDKEFAIAALQYLFPIYHSWKTKTQHISFPTSYEYTEFTKRQRIASPDYRDIYFQFGPKPGRLSDQELTNFIQGVNTIPNNDLQTFLEEKITGFKEGGQLKDFFDKLILHTDRINRLADREFIKFLALNAHTYSRTRELWNDSEADRAQALIYSLIAQNSGKIVEELMELAIEYASSDAFALRIVMFSTPQRNKIIQDFSSIDYEKLHQKSREKLHKHYLEEHQNIFTLERFDYAYILLHWAGALLADRAKVMFYLDQLFKNDPTYVGKFLEIFYSQDPLTDKFAIDMKEFEQAFDLKWIKDYVVSQSILFTTEKEKLAVEEFKSIVSVNTEKTIPSDPAQS